MRPFLLGLALSSLTFLCGYAQKATIQKVDLAGEKIIVFYDLEDSNASNEYLINLYTSKDNFSVALKSVKGDVGPEVKPGTNKRIEWNIREEFGGFKGKISLEIRGRVYLPFVKLQNFDASKSFKRGKNYTISWKPGNANPIHIELLKGNLRVQGDLNHPNNGSYLLSFPHKLKPGKDYRLRITDSRNSEEIIYTNFFSVKPKVPTLVKILPIVAIGGVVAMLAGGKKGGGDSQETPGSEIPIPDLPN